jgi:hypothetical protein
MLPEAEIGTVLAQSGSYFARHWRGELSLPRSCWINGLIVNLAANLVIPIPLIVTVAFFRDKHLLIGLLCLGEIVLQIAAYSWGLVGAWRSAVRYRGPHIWSIWARIGMSLSVLICIPNIIQELSVLSSLFSI